MGHSKGQARVGGAPSVRAPFALQLSGSNSCTRVYYVGGPVTLEASALKGAEKVAICKFQEITSNRILHRRADVVVMLFILSHRGKNGQRKKFHGFLVECQTL